MITKLHIQNYKALRDVTLNLTPMHVLIGPNDTGKTSILEAVESLCLSVEMPLSKAFRGIWTDRSIVWHGDQTRPVVLSPSTYENKQALTYSLEVEFPKIGNGLTVHAESIARIGPEIFNDLGCKGYSESALFHFYNTGSNVQENERASIQSICSSLLGVHSYKWDPRILSLPVAPDSKRGYRMEYSGFGLALCLDDILGYDRERFDALEKKFCKIFPQIKSIMLKPEIAFRAPIDQHERLLELQRADGKGIHFKLRSGMEMSAAQTSDGVMLVLAYLTLLHLPKPPRVLLIEEPENGVHPNRLKEVLTILRELIQEQSHTQVILTTHSPYVLDQFQPEEVTLCQKEDNGEITLHRLSESQLVRDQLDVFTLGEIWTGEGDKAIANGKKAKG